MILDARRPEGTEWVIVCPRCAATRRLPKSLVTKAQAETYLCKGKAHAAPVKMEVREK